MRQRKGVHRGEAVMYREKEPCYRGLAMRFGEGVRREETIVRREDGTR